MRVLDRLRRDRLPIELFAAALASSLLYASVLLSFAFLVPVQAAYGRSGRRAGAIASAMTVVGLAPIFIVRLAEAEAFSLIGLALSLVPPALLLGAIALMNARLWKGGFEALRILVPALICALVALPAILFVSGDRAFGEYLNAELASILEPLNQRIGEAAGEGFESAALAAMLDPSALAEMAIAILRNSYAALILALLGGSWWIGNRAAGPGSRGQASAPALDELRVPTMFIWPFLGSWTLLLAALLLKAPGAVSAVAWNLALCLSFAYATQGLGIADHYLKKWNTPKGLRALLAATAVAAAATSPAGVAIAIAVPLLGVTEVWIPHRNSKGVGV